MFSQGPTLTKQNTGPQPGDVFVGLYADTTGISIGASGANHLWDYSNLIIGATKNEEDYTTNDTSGFPAATASYYYSAGMENVIKVDTAEYSVLGELNHPVPYMAPVTTMIYSYPQKIFSYPFNFSDEITNPFVGLILPYYQSIPATYRNGISATFADGWGTLLLPSKTFTNVLRVKIIEDYTDSIVTTNPPHDTLMNVHKEQYLWYDGINKNPLLKILLTPGINNKIIKSILVAEGFNGINNLSDCKIEFNLYPNPADNHSMLTVTTTERVIVSISILDMTGIEMVKLTAQTFNLGTSFVPIDFGTLPGGLYFVKCESSLGSVVKKIILR